MLGCQAGITPEQRARMRERGTTSAAGGPRAAGASSVASPQAATVVGSAAAAVASAAAAVASAAAATPPDAAPQWRLDDAGRKKWFLRFCGQGLVNIRMINIILR